MEYKVEEYRFMNAPRNNPEGLFGIEKKWTVQMKIEFIDELRNGVATYLLDLFAKWEAEKDSLPQERPGYVKTVSFKAWLRRNDPRGLINNDRYGSGLGSYRMFGTVYRHMDFECKSTYREQLVYEGKHIVHQWFHDLCKTLAEQERRHFLDHDPYHIKLRKIREYADAYGVFFDNQQITDIWNGRDDIPEAEVDCCLQAYEKIERYTNQVKMELEEELKEIEHVKEV